MKINESTISSDKALKATLEAFVPDTGEGQLKIEELTAEKGRFYVTVKYGSDGQTRIDYKTYDVHKTANHQFLTNRNDVINSIEIVRVIAD